MTPFQCLWSRVRLSYAAKLFILLLITLLVPIGYLGRVAVESTEEAAERTALGELHRQAGSVAQAMENMLGAASQISDGLALTLYPLSGQARKAETVLIGFRQASPLITRYAAVGEDGIEWAASDGRLEQIDWKRHPEWERIRNVKKQRFLLQTGQGQSPQVLLVTALPRVPEIGRRRLICRIDLIGLWRMAERLRFGQSGRAELYTHGGFALVGRDQVAVVEGKPLREEAIRDLLNRERGGSLHHRNEFLAGARIPSLDLRVLLRVRAAEVFAEAERVKRALYWVLAGSMALALLFSILLPGVINRPLRTLSLRARQIAEGELELTPLPDRSDEIGVLYQDFNEMVDRLGEMRSLERQAAIGEAVERIAHDLGTPLTAFKAFLSRLTKSPGDESVVRSFLEIVPEEVERLDRLLQQMREYSQAQPYTLRPGSLNEVVEGVVQLYRPLAGQKGIRLTLDLAAEEGLIPLDEDRLKRVIVNLLNNALDCLSQGQTIWIGSLWTKEKDSATVQLLIEDNGPGVPEEIAGRLFRPFVSRREGGLGLGLAICRTIVTAHGGSIRHEPADNGGARFVITLESKLERNA
ncbi:MAG: sensor histidine kinase [Planctomycetota bacterium]